MFVLQPNGLLAFFDSGREDFTMANLTLEEAFSQASDPSEVTKALRDEMPDQPEVYGEGLFRWQHCLARIRQAHGEETERKWKSSLA